MTAACVDWQPLAAWDPVPGDPQAVRGLADGYAGQAERVGMQAAAVRRLAESPTPGGSSAGTLWTGPAAEAFRARARHLPSDLDAVAARFQRVARSLREFAPALESAQRRARAALAAAHEAQARGGVPPGTPLTDPATLMSGAPTLFVLGEVEQARRALDRACAERDLAAARCARSLAAAGHDRLRNASTWRRLLRSVSRIAGLVSTGLGVAAFVLCPIPGVGQIVGAAALAAGLVALASDGLLVEAGDKGVGTLASDVFGVLPAGRTLRTAAMVPRGLGGGAGVARSAARVASPRVARDLAEGVRDLTAAAQILRAPYARAAIGERALWSAFANSPGGFAHEVARAEAVHGTRGLTLVTGTYAVDLAHSEVAFGQQYGWPHDHRRVPSHRGPVRPGVTALRAAR